MDGGPVDVEQLRRLQLVTDAALAHLDLEELLGALLERTRDALETDTAAFLMLDGPAQELVARAAVGIEEEVEAGVRIPLGRGFAGRVAADRHPVVLPDVDHADVLNPILHEKGIKSLLGVPLLVGGEAIGVLHVGSLVPRDFTPADVELLQLVAGRAALAIDHARLFEAERDARVRLERLQSVTDVALAHLDLERLLAALLERTRAALEADTAAFLMLDEVARELVVRAAFGIEEAVDAGIRVPLGRGFAGRVAAECRPIVLPDVDRADVVNPILREKGIKSLLGVPLLFEERAIGVLHVGSLTPRDFTAGDTELLQLVAERAALAIERARVHDEVVRLDQLKLNFVAVASHELRTPATSVYGIVATLRARGDDLDEATRVELEEVLWEQANRLRRLIEQLLDLARLDAHALPVAPSRVVLAEVVDSAVRLVRPHPGTSPVEVDMDPELTVVGDALALERVLANLVGNAFRHGRPPVHIRAGTTNGGVRIDVEDAGDGVPPEIVPRLFERFERGGEGRGTGLGLAIAKTYAQALGGDISYEPGERGACFSLVLPGQPAAPAADG